MCIFFLYSSLCWSTPKCLICENVQITFVPHDEILHYVWCLRARAIFICGCSSFHIGASYLSRHWCLSQGTSDRRSSPGSPKTTPWGPQTALGVLRPQTETMYSWDTLFISLPQVPQQREKYGILEPKFHDGGHCQSVLRRQCVLLLPPSISG